MDEMLTDDMQTVWDYMLLHHQPHPGGILLVLGSRDDRVARYAAQLAVDTAYDFIVLSGGSVARNTNARQWTEPTEAEHFEAVMRQAGWHGAVVLEKEATNTGENADLSFKLLKEQGATPVEMLTVVTKPYMERRVLATFGAQWPDAHTNIVVTSPKLSFDDYCSAEQPRDQVVTVMVGDLQRIIEYPKRGFMIRQTVPDRVLAAYKRLIAAGYTQHLLS